MECVELYNTSDRDIDFNSEYEFAYLYKSSYYVQPVTTVANAANGTTSDKTGVIIPAHGAAVIWCYREEGLAGKYTSFPTLDDFRSAYDLPDGVPVYAQTGQSGWGNTDRGIALLKKNSDDSRSSVSYYYWNGVTDLKDNKSVDLKISANGPKMSIYKTQSATNMGVVAEDQYTFYPDDGSVPELQLLDNSDEINEGDFFRVPYYYAGTNTLPVGSIDFYYKTSAQDSYTIVSTSAFAIYNKFYPFIDNSELLGADYIDYYLKANNAYRSKTTEVRRIKINKNDNYNGLRVNINGAEMINDKALSGKVNISAKNFDDKNANITFAIDGNETAGTHALERYSYFTFDYSGVDSYFKNGLTTGDYLIGIFAKCSEIPSTDSLAIPVSQSLFTYKEDGTATIELTVRAGTYGSTWEADTAANNDDFTAGNFKLRLTDGTIISPTTTVNMSGTSIDPTIMTKLGDSSGCTICVSMTFTIPEDKIDASSFVIDTTTLQDGSHTLSVSSGVGHKELSFTVDNTVAVEPEAKKTDINVAMSVNGSETATATVTTGSDVKTVTAYKAKTVDGITVKEGAGDSTATAAAKTDTQATVSSGGEYPYQILEIPVADESIEALRVKLNAEVNYTKSVQLYVLNTAENVWDIIENTTEKDGVVSGICKTKDHVVDGVAKVLIQARGTEYTPYMKADTHTTMADDYVWDGTGIPERYDFSMAWITDTQYYAEQYMDNFNAITNWIVDNKDNQDIRYVVHTGDIVDEFNEEYEYVNASSQLKKFEDAGIPYGVLAGNHDVAHGNMRYDLYWKYFGEKRYESSPVYGDSYRNNLGHYDLVTVDGQELLMIYMSWDIYYPESAWINEVLAKYPDRKAIICIHGGINNVGAQSYQSDFLLDNVCKNNKNVFAIINGHFHGSALNFIGFDDNGDNVNDRVVYQICTDYQSAEGGGSGYIKMIYFDLANNKIYLNSYSPVLNDFNYYDTPKLGSYGIGTLAADIDITELSVDFDRKKERTLTVGAVSVSGLTSEQLGSSERSGAQTSVRINADIGDTVNTYAVLRDGKGNILGYTDTALFTVSHDNEPVLTAGSVSRTSGSAATVKFTSSEAGQYYYAVVNDGEKIPEIDTTVTGTACDTTEQTITLNDISSSGAKDIYIVVKDAAGNVSTALKIDIPSYSSGGSTGGGSGTTTAPSVETSTSSNTTTTSGTLNASTDSSGKASGSISSATASALVEGAKAAESAGKEAVVEIKLKMDKSAKAAEISLPKSSFDSLASGTSAELRVNTDLGAISFDASAVDAINSAASGDIKISVAKADTSGMSDEVRNQIGNRTVYDFTVTSSGKTIFSFGKGSASITLPYTPSSGEDLNAIVVYYISDSGKLETVRGVYNSKTGTVDFVTDHFSRYTIGYNKVVFGDVAGTDWYYKAVTFNAARGITTGTSSSTFSPNGTLTRGQFIVMLMRAYGIKADANPVNNFSDAGNTYYTNYLAAAKRLGISTGIGSNQFAPESEISRQDMFTLLYRALNVIGELPDAATTKTTSDFGDAGEISSYAKDAMNSLVKAGIISGSNNSLNPLGTSTRAEMAQVLYKLLSV